MTIHDSELGYMATLTQILVQSQVGLSSKPEHWRVAREVLLQLKRARRPEAKTPLSVIVLHTPEPGAFSLPNGRIYLTTGLLESSDTLDGVAGVMGHEISHVDLKHSEQRMDRIDTSASLGGLGMLFTHTLDQQEELQADREGLRLALRAGFKASGLRDYFERLELLEAQRGVRLGGFMQSHPTLGLRIRELEEVANEFKSESAFKVSPRTVAEFAALKRASGAAQLEYSPQWLSAETPPRFKAQDPAFGAELLRYFKQLQMNQDLKEAAEGLDRLGSSSRTSQKGRAIALFWATRAHEARGAIGEAHRSSEKMHSLLPPEHGLEGVSWQEIELVAASGQSAVAAQQWKARATSPECVASTECLGWALKVGQAWNAIEPEDRLMAARALKALLAKEPDGALYSLALTQEIVSAIALENPEFEADRSADHSHTKLSPQALDALELEADLKDHASDIPRSDSGLVLLVGATGNTLPNPFGLNMPLAPGGRMALEVLRHPWQSGLLLELSGLGRPSSSGNWHSRVRVAWESLHTFGPPRRLRFFGAGSVGYVRLQQAVGDEIVGVTDGVSFELGAGIGLRLNSRQSWLNWGLALQGGAVFDWMGAALASDGRTLGAYLTLQLAVTEAFGQPGIRRVAGNPNTLPPEFR